MFSERDVRGLSLHELCLRCREQTNLYRQFTQHDDRYCYELIRRAVDERDEACWEEMQSLYRDQLAVWCRAAANTRQDDLDAVLSAVWLKFWQNYTPEKRALARDTNAALRYLKLCARSVAIDAARTEATESRLRGTRGVGSEAPSPADIYVDQAQRDDFWQLIDGLLKSDEERLLVELMYELDLKPAQIHQARPDVFASSMAVYNVSRNVLDRLRRSARLRDWLEQHGQGPH
jgi:hypothetical protein